MQSLSDLARLAGYTVISNNSPTVMELAGNGDWGTMERACRKVVYRGISGRVVDHVTVVVRDEWGNRQLRDVGLNQVRYGKLPPVKKSLLGVCIRGKRYVAQTEIIQNGKRHHVWIGTFDDRVSAGIARDRFIIEHRMRTPLNFSNPAVELT